MTLESKEKLVNLLYSLHNELLQEAETTQEEIDQTIDQPVALKFSVFFQLF